MIPKLKVQGIAWRHTQGLNTFPDKKLGSFVNNTLFLSLVILCMGVYNSKLLAKCLGPQGDLNTRLKSIPSQINSNCILCHIMKVQVTEMVVLLL